MGNFEIKENHIKETLEDATNKIERALTSVGLQAENDVRNVTPVDTGNLRNSITSRVKMDENAVYVGTNVEYAPHQELGTSKMRAANNGKGFLRYAINTNLGKYKTLLEDGLKN